MVRRAWLGALGWTLFVLPGTSFAQSYPGGTPPPQVRGEKFFRGSEGFGRTGTDILVLLAIALVLVCLGLILYWVTRRSPGREA